MDPKVHLITGWVYLLCSLLTRKFWHLICSPIHPLLLGQGRFKPCLGPVTSCCSCLTARWRPECWGEGPWALVTSVKAIMVGVGFNSSLFLLFRPDRDEWVTIFRENIMVGKSSPPWTYVALTLVCLPQQAEACRADKNFSYLKEQSSLLFALLVN